MRSTRFILVAVALSFPFSLSAQTDEELIVGVAEALFSAMLEKDEAAIRGLFVDGARLLAVDSRSQPTRVVWSSEDLFVQRITGPSNQLLERMWNPSVRIDGDLAQLWTEYDFYTDGVFSHCGIDAFHMVRTDEGWKIGHITYNRRTQDCYSPLGKPVPRL